MQLKHIRHACNAMQTRPTIYISICLPAPLRSLTGQPFYYSTAYWPRDLSPFQMMGGWTGSCCSSVREGRRIRLIALRCVALRCVRACVRHGTVVVNIIHYPLSRSLGLARSLWLLLLSRGWRTWMGPGRVAVAGGLSPV
jgi:hypothetical protein